jgi:2-polyprenyl-3-methyl-5-hydroxy-6-metoxy-1,4-benzoquinol methylase
VLGLDINAPRLEVANARRDWVQANVAPKLRVEFQKRSVLEVDHEPFDVIWMEQALHHLEPRAEVMEKLASLLKPGGYLVASEANALNPIMQIKLFVERGFDTIGTTVDSEGKTHLYGNERILTVSGLRRAAEQVGIRSVAHRYFRCFPARDWAQRVAWVESICPQWLPFVFTHYNFVGVKKR